MINLQGDERVDDLQYKGLKIIQKIKGFCFGIDAVLLAGFVDAKCGDKIADLGTGTAIIPILIAGYTKAKYIAGLEIQKEVAEMATRSVEMNDLSDKIDIINGDIKSVDAYLPKSTFDIVISNPPYVKNGGGLLNDNDTKTISRHEVLCAFSDVAVAASILLRSGGSFYLIHRPERLVDILCDLRKNMLEPKLIKFIHPNEGKAPNLVLIKAIKNGGPELKILNPFYLYDNEGNYIGGFEKMRGGIF